MAFVLGLDENGLGPRLGPMLVTAVALEARPDVAGAERAARGKPPRHLRERLADSKELVRYGESSLGEAWARAIAARLELPAESPDELLHALASLPREGLRAPCPREHEAQCWSVAGETFAAPAEAVARAHRDLDTLARRGLAVRALRTTVLCTRRLNEAATRGVSRFAVDLHAMEDLVLTLQRELGGAEVHAICGKVGGYDRYAPAFGPLAGRLHVALEEGRAESRYRFPGVGTLAFVRDADASHLVVSLASLVGKWARDLLMARIVRHYRAADASLPDASGYHDPVTTRFVDATALVRRARGVPDDCFERVSAKSAGGGEAGEARRGNPRGAAKKAATTRQRKS